MITRTSRIWVLTITLTSIAVASLKRQNKK